MTKLYLLDTNIASYAIKGVAAVRRHIERLPMAQLAISAVTEAELLYDVARRPEATRLLTVVNEFLLRISTQPWDSNVARHYGALRAAQERQGHAIVTNDQAFGRISRLKIENWAA